MPGRWNLIFLCLLLGCIALWLRMSHSVASRPIAKGDTARGVSVARPQASSTSKPTPVPGDADLPNLVIVDLTYEAPYLNVIYANDGCGHVAEDFTIALDCGPNGWEDRCHKRPSPGQQGVCGRIGADLLRNKFGYIAELKVKIDPEDCVQETDESDNSVTFAVESDKNGFVKFTRKSASDEPRKAAGPLPNESAILAAVLADHVKNLKPRFQPGEVVIVSSDIFSPQAEIEDSYGRQNLMKACKEIGVDPAVLDVLAHNSQPGQWDLDSWPTSVKLRNTEEFYRHFSGIETFNDALEKGGPGRQVFSFCRPVLDESTGDIVVYAREWTVTQYGVLYRLRPGRGDGHLQVIFKSREIGIY